MRIPSRSNAVDSFVSSSSKFSFLLEILTMIAAAAAAAAAAFREHTPHLTILLLQIVIFLQSSHSLLQIHRRVVFEQPSLNS